VSEIAAASQEQSAGIEQVNQAVGQMDEMTQQNAALVEEAAAAAESLQEQTGRLMQTVSVFRLDGVAPGAPAVLPAPARGTAAAAASRATPAPASGSAPAHARAARPRKRAVAGGGDEWEAF
jgi:hypothetical protein